MSISNTTRVHGHVQPDFIQVADAFASNFNATLATPEVGAAFALIVDGEVVVDLWSGHSDSARSKPWARDTIVNTYSTTKGITAACTTLLESRGELDYTRPVAYYWPEFATHGKGGLSVETALSHRAGVSGLRSPVTMSDLYDWDKMTSLIAAAEPLWIPGSKAGYHAITWGYIAGELVRRVTGQSIGNFLRDEVAGPLKADYMIGVPENEDGRVAEMIAPLGEPTQSLAEMTEILQLTLLNPHIQPTAPNDRAFRAAELPALGGIGTALGIARIYAPLALGGSFEGIALYTPEAITRAARPRFCGIDINTGVEARWGAGFFGNNAKHWYGPNSAAFGHSGWGGSMGFADPKARIALGYVCNQMDADLNGDPRGLRLVAAVYDSIAKIAR